MPVYNYECKGCGESCEIFHEISADRPSCPSCHNNKLEREYKSSASLAKQRDIQHPGDQVKEFIKSAKEDLKEQTKVYKGREL